VRRLTVTERLAHPSAIAMLIEDPDVFTLILLNRDGTPFLRRALDYLQRVRYPGQVLICDSSHPGHAEFVAGSQAAYPDLWLELALHPPATGFFDKLEMTLDRLTSEHVMLCANDDFVVVDGLEHAVAALVADPGLSCARGRSVMFELIPPTAPGGAAGVELSLYPMRSYPQEDGRGRMLDFVANYSTTLYSAQRRQLLLENIRYTPAQTQNTIFWQYLFSSVTAVQGRILCLDEPFYIRQGRGESESGRLRRDSYEHWPLFITAPDFSREYQNFRRALLAFLAARAGSAAPDGAALDRAAVGLMHRGFCGREYDNAADLAFYQRSRADGTPENTLLREITQFAAAYPDTY